MKKISLAIIAIFAFLSTLSVYADCSQANNYCGGTVYRCDIYCVGNSYNYEYCQRNCAGWTNTRYIDNTNYYYPSYTDYRNYSSYNYDYYRSNTYNFQNNCYYDRNSYYRCDGRNYPSWYPRSSWFWSDEDLALMTESMNFDSIASARQPDFFQTNVIGKDNNRKRLAAIKIKQISFGNEEIANKLEDSKRFLTALKDATWQRYSDGVIKNYQMADIIRDLGDMIGSLNDYFAFSKKYETTGNDFYDELAMEKLDDVKQQYEQLKGTLKFR